MTEDTRIRHTESDFARRCFEHPKGYHGVVADTIPRKPPAPATPATFPSSNSYTQTVIQDCEGCAGSGNDPGNLDPFEFEPCTFCCGSGKQKVERNFLAEAFRIVAGASHQTPEKRHLCAVVEYCRELTSAAINLPEVA